jgi:DnaK suppressor protein
MRDTINQQELQEKLKERLEFLSHQLKDSEQEVRSGVMANPDRSDLARISTQRNRSSIKMARAEKQRREIERALQRMENGTYGTCMGCGKLIHPARLESIPEATLCIECKQDK